MENLQRCQKEWTHVKLAHRPSGYSNWNVSRVCRDLFAMQEVKLSHDQLQQQQWKNLDLEEELFFTVQPAVITVTFITEEEEALPLIAATGT